MAVTRVVLGRRPNVGQQAFGHVALNSDAQAAVEGIVAIIHRRALSLRPVDYDPDDIPQSDEVMFRPLAGIDGEFQPSAAWSLERTVNEINKRGNPGRISRAEAGDGMWSFYALRATVDHADAIVVRATSPTRALKHDSRFIAQFTGGELRPMTDPLLGLDYAAEALTVDGTVYIFHPQALERLLIDAEEIKARAPQIAAKFSAGLAAKLSATASALVEAACSRNSNVGRRVERMNRAAALVSMTEAKLREGLKDAHLPSGTFGRSGTPIHFDSIDHANALIDIAADLYYQPRFEQGSRRVAAFRRLA